MITAADLAAAWASGYWHGTSHEGPLNDAVVAAKNPYRARGTDPGILAPDSPTD
ncbi:hypothetical protein HTS88_15625 [Pseudarthrobacter oxydans]|uniref:hypothetical protein n=1 Tax=Pseudarthrobacter oxydans TaxID=1671 RepID=UPI0015747E12|nr:hypothetical protein [Pseudarthrobacter oxydans]NSX37813.1 hypothetical protein [Pseudarthrobacter oxydans]